MKFAERPHQEVAIQTQVSFLSCILMLLFSAMMMDASTAKNTSLKKNLGIPKHPKCPPKQKNCMALGKQENIMEVNVICHLITLGRTFQGLICCHLLATQLENGNRQKIQRFNMIFHGKNKCNFWIF